MISVDKLRQTMEESTVIPDGNPVTRNDYFNWLIKSSKNKLIKVVTGFRRSGKSYLLKMFSRYLLAHKIPKENIFYLNFENDLLINIKSVDNLRTIWELYLTEIAVLDKPIFIIWDEIQLVNSWEKLIRTLYETGKYNIYLSGSNSNLLSGELSSSLSGRSIEVNITPFSFDEYLKYVKLDIKEYYSDKYKIDRGFITYLRRGGLVEQFKLDENMASNYKEGLIQKIILDDIAKRYQIDKIKVLQNIFQFVSGNITSTLSLRKTVNRLKDQSIDISSTTLDNYLYYWETSYALSKLTKFDYKLVKVFDRTAKYYLVDNIFIPGREESDEKRLENTVYNELVRRYGKENVFFGSEANGYEVDFVVKQENKYLFFQVCLILNDINFKREIGNLILISKYLKGKATVLTLKNVAKLESNVSIKPIVSWLLEK